MTRGQFTFRVSFPININMLSNETDPEAIRREALERLDLKLKKADEVLPGIFQNAKRECTYELYEEQKGR